MDMTWEKIVRIKYDLLSLSILDYAFKNYFMGLLGWNFSYYCKYIDGDCFYFAERRKQIQNKIKENLISNISNIINLIKRQSENFLQYTKGLYKLETKSNIKRLFSDYVEVFGKVFCLIMLPLEIEEVLTEALEKHLEKRIHPEIEFKKFKYYFNALCISNEETEVIREKQDLLKISVSISKDKKLKDLFSRDAEKIKEQIPKDLLSEIKQHQQKYAWQGIRVLIGEPLDLDYYLDRIKEYLKDNPKKELDRIIETKKKEKDEFKKVIDELDPSEEFLKLINFMQDIVFLRTWRFDQLHKGNFLARPLLEGIARRMDLTYTEFICLTLDEIIDFLENGTKLSIEEIKKRQKGFALIPERKTCVTGKELELLKKQEEKKIEDAIEIVGHVACGGRAKGVVRIILDKSEIAKVQKGDILVAVTTTPDFVVAMEKAAAIVTDIGGITSHAAIISRELGIPCVIGTEIATKVLKDGDVVEVDADKGVIKRVS